MRPVRKEEPCPRADPIVTGNHPWDPARAIWRSNGSPDWLLKFTIAGQARFGLRDDGGEVISGAGDLVIIKPHSLHDYGTYGPEPWHMIWAVFDPPASWAELLDWPAAGPGIMRMRIDDPAIFERVSVRLHEMHEFAKSSGSYRRRLRQAMNSLEAALLWCDAVHPAAGAAMDPRLRRAIQHICSNLSSRLDLAELSDMAGVSPAQLGRLFGKQVGMTPQAFVEKQRLARARQLLQHTALTIQAIAWEVGFESPFYFARRFRLLQGASPSDYRRRAQESR